MALPSTTRVARAAAVLVPALMITATLGGCRDGRGSTVEQGSGSSSPTATTAPAEPPGERPPGTADPAPPSPSSSAPGSSVPPPPSSRPAPPPTDPPPPSTAPPPTTPPTPPPTTQPPEPPPTTTPPPLTEPLRRGDEGALVVFLQQRLAGLRYWLGPIDGVYGPLTEQAVMAFQKASGTEISGVASPAVVRALQQASPVVPASATGAVVEVDKARQLLIVARDGEAELVLNTSTGTELPYRHPSGATLLADTPPGHHTFFSQYDGTQPGELGPLYRPKYFHVDGIAVHGYGSVPARPASHGCVRVSFAAMDHLWAAGLAPMGGAVWVYGTAPAPVPAR